MLLNYLLIPITLFAFIYLIKEIKSLYRYIKNDLVDEIASTIEVQKDDNYNK